MEFEKNMGNRVEIEKGNEVFEGILLPSPEKGIVLLKLDNGYNIGFFKKDIIKLKVIEKIKSKEKNLKLPFSRDKKNVAMVILGGTIAARLNPGKGGVDFVENPNDLFKYYPEVFEKVNISKVEIPFMKGSENMDFKDWQKIAKVVCDLVKDKNIEGIVVTQGTDTLHYTSAALSFFLRDLGKPVVLTYSQRSIDRGSSDARLNLICAAQVAVSDISGVIVVGHANSDDEFCYGLAGTKVRKLHSSRRDAFKPVNREPFVKVYQNKTEFISEYNKRNEKLKCFCDDKFEEKIALLKFYPGQDPTILDYYLEKGYKGIVIEAMGLGQIATRGARLSWIKKLKEVQEKGLIVCMAAQTIYGRLNPLVYITGRELLETGVLYLEDMLSETAFVKLGWVLGHKNWSNSKEKVKEKMLNNFSWELNDRLVE
jgi:glutamyl-tRNA(Gln) amidotransferase subunit D